MRLTVVNGPRRADIELDPAKPLSFGRSSTQGVQLDDPSVSRRHARFVLEGGQWHVFDEQSRHGTFVNGVRLEAGEGVPLDAGDRITMGPWTMLLTEEGRAPSTLASQADEPVAHSSIKTVGKEELGELARRRLALLMEAQRTIHRCADAREAAGQVAETLRESTGAERVAIIQPAAGLDELDLLAWAGPGGPDQGADPVISRTLLSAASRGEVVRLSDERIAQGAMSIISQGVTEALCAPVMIDGQIDCYLYVDSRGSSRNLQADSPALCLALADLLGLALANIQRHELELRQERLIRDMRAAHDVQRRIMPPLEGRVGEASYRLYCEPGRFVAGDFFGVLPAGERTLVFLGDVAGKGLGAALQMAAIQSHISAIVNNHENLADLVSSVNSYVATHSAENEFASLWVCLLDPGTRKMISVDAGHGYAVRISASSPPILLPSDGGLPVGIDRNGSYEESDHQLAEQDRIVLFSDGLPEQQAPSGEQYGVERILACLEGSASHEEDLTRLRDGVKAFAEQDQMADDLTIASFHLGS